MSWCPASVILRDMQIKRTVSRYLSFLRVATNNSKQDPQKTTCVGENATVVDSRREDSMVQPLRKTVWRFLRRLTTELPYNLPISLLAIEPQKPKSRSQRGRCTPMCTAALFAIATERKQLKWVSPDAWKNTHTQKKAGGAGRSGNPVTCSNLKKRWGRHAKFEKPVRKGQTLCVSSYMRYLEYTQTQGTETDRT